MNRIKKILGVIVIAMFLSTITLNIGLFRNAQADPNCPGLYNYDEHYFEPGGSCWCIPDQYDCCVCDKNPE